jgi:hypothetical protein
MKIKSAPFSRGRARGRSKVLAGTQAERKDWLYENLQREGCAVHRDDIVVAEHPLWREIIEAAAQNCAKHGPKFLDELISPMSFSEFFGDCPWRYTYLLARFLSRGEDYSHFDRWTRKAIRLAFERHQELMGWRSS